MCNNSFKIYKIFVRLGMIYIYIMIKGIYIYL